MTVIAKETKADYPFNYPARTDGERAIVKAVNRMDAVGDADYVLEDFDYDEICEAARMIDALREFPFQSYFTYSECLSYSWCPYTKGRRVRALNLLLRLGIFDVWLSPDEDYDVPVFAMNSKYDPWTPYLT